MSNAQLAGQKQSRLMSLVESIANVAVGYGLALATQLVVFSWFGIDVALPEHLAIGAAFTAVSILRSYLLRRLFEAWRIRARPPSSHAAMR